MSLEHQRLLMVIPGERSFRGLMSDLARVARQADMQVTVATSAPDNGAWLHNHGFRYVPLTLRRGARNPVGEAMSIFRLTRLYRREKPAIVHHMFMKPILYGSWAARVARVPAVVNTFAGLGFGFSATGWPARLLRAGLTAGLRSALALRNSRALFENGADRERLIRANVVRPEQAVLMRAGIDVARFTPAEEPAGTPIVLFASRMLWSKGVGELIEAAKLLKRQGVRVRFVFAGPSDPDNPTSVTEAQLRAWHQVGLIDWLGQCEEMPPIVAASHIIALPTYYGEGLPRILLEACACARPVVATPIPACREIISDGDNGILVPPKDAEALAKAIRMLVESPTLRLRMGKKGRERVVEEFSIESVAHRTLQIYGDLLKKASTCPLPEGAWTDTSAPHEAHSTHAE
jgi:glycosyltransferase involved in cell wall biosynthesis